MRRIVSIAVSSVAMLLSAATISPAQSLGEAAQRAKEQQKASRGSTFKLDDHDVDPRLAAQEVLDYEVNADRWREFLAAQVWVNQVLEKDAALMERLMGLRTQTARAVERAIAREPSLVKALGAAGSNAHDFAFTQVALTVAILFDSDPRLAASIPQLPAATQANIALVRAHGKELQSMQAVTNAMKAGMEKK